MEIINKLENCGAYGIATEKAVKEALHLLVKVSRQGRTDVRKNFTCYEIKTGAGELGNKGEKLLKGSTMVVYIPLPLESKDGTLDIKAQEGFVMSREIFLSTLENIKMLREKKPTSGKQKITIQTFWNRSKMQPHGRGYFKMLDAFYELEGQGVTTLTEWLEQFE